MERQGQSEVGADVCTSSRLKQVRLENRLARERIESARLRSAEARQNRLTRYRERVESLPMAWDWVSPYAEFLDRARGRDPIAAGPAVRWQREQGRNYPIYQNETELALLRAPSRLLCATNSNAIGFSNTIVSYVLGTGCTYRIAAKQHEMLPDGLVEACQGVIDDILEKNDWHGGEQPGIEEEAVFRSLEDGEYLLTHHKCEGGHTEFRFAEPETLTQPIGTDFNEWSFGIRTDPNDTQRHLAYWLQYNSSIDSGEEFSPEEITHLRRNVRRGMKRGYPDFSFDTHEATRLAAVLRQNLTEAAAEQAAIVGVRQHQTATQSEIQQFVDADADWREPILGTAKEMPTRRARTGWEDIPNGMAYVNGPGANNATVHLAVMDACLRGGVMRWNFPEWMATGYASNTNFATSLTAESPLTIRVKREQNGYVSSFRRAVMFALKWAADSGRIVDSLGNVWRWSALQRVIELHVEAPNPQSRNKLEEAQIAQIEIPLGLDSPQQYVQRQGRDWQQVTEDNHEYQAEHGQTQQPLPLPGDPRQRFESELVESYDEDKHPRDDHGRFVKNAEIEKAKSDPAVREKLLNRVTDPKQRAALETKISESKKGRVGKAKNAVADIVASETKGVGHVWRGVKWTAHKIEAAMSVVMKKSQQVAMEAARQRGLPEDHVQRVGRVLGAIDFAASFVSSKAATVATGGNAAAGFVAGMMPTASAAYLAYSTVRNPLATLRAAKAAVYSTPHPNHKLKAESLSPELVDSLFKLFSQTKDHDWAEAVLHVCIDDHPDDPHQAISVARSVLTKHPANPHDKAGA